MAVIKTEIILFIQNNHIYNFYNSTFQKIKMAISRNGRL